MICHIIGIPYEEGEVAKRLGGGLLMPLNPDSDAATIANGHTAVAEFKDLVLALVSRVRKQLDIEPIRDCSAHWWRQKVAAGGSRKTRLSICEPSRRSCPRCVIINALLPCHIVNPQARWAAGAI